MTSHLPKAILLDLDDTILIYGSADECWRRICDTFAPKVEGTNSGRLLTAILEARDWYWGEPERHRVGRLDQSAARKTIVSSAFSRLGLDSPTVARDIAHSYKSAREAGMALSYGAIDTLRHLLRHQVRLALVTNGAGDAQRTKIDRFRLGPLFDYILVEGEFGTGKPDERVYGHALEQLDSQAAEAWMVGDNLEWDVGAPQRLGIFGIWFNPSGSGLPVGSAVRPDCIIRELPELIRVDSGL